MQRSTDDHAAQRPVTIQVNATSANERPIRVTMDLGDDTDPAAYDIDRDQARFLVHQLQMELARTLRAPVLRANSGG